MISHRLTDKELARHMMAIVSSSGDAIFSKTLGGIVTSWNRGAELLYGYTGEEMVGRHVSVLVPPERHGEEIRILDRIAAGHSVSNYETRRMTKDGNVLDVSLTISKIEDDTGGIVGASVIARDITEQKRVQEEAAAAREEAERTNRAKSEFLSRMSHELRTPLSAILGFAQLLDGGRLDEDQKECARNILEGGHRLQRLINEVLDISRIEAGQFRLSLEPVPLAEVIRQDVALIGPLAREAGIGVEVDTNDMSEVLVKADRQRLSQVLLNLLSNAVKYNVDGGSVIVGYTRTEDSVMIAVADTGPGISSDQLERLFDPFERLDADDTNIEGTGLGLSVAKGLVEAMEGDLRVDSAPGRGSVFYVELGFCEGEKDEDRLSIVQLDDESPQSSGSVLYIEDNVANIRLVKGILRQRPEIELLTAMTARDGFEMARTHRPDLILLDRHLPDGTGEEVLARLRRDPVTHRISTIILSADAYHESVERLKAIGADDYLTKPIDFEVFLKLIDRFTRSKEIA